MNFETKYVIFIVFLILMSFIIPTIFTENPSQSTQTYEEMTVLNKTVHHGMAGKVMTTYYEIETNKNNYTVNGDIYDKLAFNQTYNFTEENGEIVDFTWISD